jgi:hypothetical protein
MGLTCSCDFEWDGDGWCFTGETTQTTLGGKRAKKCISCGERIPVGAAALAHGRMRGPRDEIEERIRGEEVPIASQHHCERCGDLHDSLVELGYCVNPSDDMRSLVMEYAETKAREAENTANRKFIAGERRGLGCLDSDLV